MTSILEKLAEELGHQLQYHHLTLVTAESCTGGGLSAWITHIPGSSTWFDRGFVTYSNSAKVEMLKVNPDTLETFGAVSEQIAREMAEGSLQNSHGDISIAITGIAGPTGGSADKPVGMVWFGVAMHQLPTLTVCKIFNGDRQAIRDQAIEKALQLILEVLKK